MKGTGKRAHSVKKILSAIEGTGGIRSEIAKRLGCSIRTIYYYISEIPEVKQAVKEEEDKVLDMAESNLFLLIQNGDTSAIFYYLNNKGKARGYGYQKNPMLEQDTTTNERKTGVLVTPGILTEDTWEKTAENAAKGGETEAQKQPEPEQKPEPTNKK